MTCGHCVCGNLSRINCRPAGSAVMLKFLYELLLGDEPPPDRIGPVGFAIMGAFLLFCCVVFIYA
jgi:hypothetical protein